MFFSRFRLRAPVMYCALLSMLVLALALFLLAFSPDISRRRVWKKYHTLYIEQTGVTEELIRRIDGSREFSQVVSRYTSQVGLNTFDGFEAVPINRISARLDPRDPRLDPYMRRVERLFSVERGFWEVLYLRSDRNLLSTYFRLRKLLAGTSAAWRLMDFNPLEASIRLLLFLLFLIVGALSCSEAAVRLAVLLASLPWLFLVVLSGFPSLLAFFLLLPAWMHLFERLRACRVDPALFEDTRIGIALFPALLTLAAACGLSVLFLLPGPLGGLLLSVLGGVPAAAFLWFLLVSVDSRRVHPLFRALPILRRLRPRRASMSRAGTLHLLLALIVLCSYPLLRAGQAFSGPPPEVVRMHPLAGSPAGLSWGSLDALKDYSTGIPNLADYLAHRAYQESLLFARPYSFPRMGERIHVASFRVYSESTPLHVQKTFRVVKQFKESWLRSTVEAAAPGSVARLLSDQGYAGVVDIGGTEEPMGRYSVWSLLAVLFLLHFLLRGRFNLTVCPMYATRNLTLRRR
jgi:hypothetical protein